MSSKRDIRNKEIADIFAEEHKLAKELDLPALLTYLSYEIDVETKLGIANKYTFLDETEAKVTLVIGGKAFARAIQKIKTGDNIYLDKEDGPMGKWFFTLK